MPWDSQLSRQISARALESSSCLSRLCKIAHSRTHQDWALPCAALHQPCSPPATLHRPLQCSCATSISWYQLSCIFHSYLPPSNKRKAVPWWHCTITYRTVVISKGKKSSWEHFAHVSWNLLNFSLAKLPFFVAFVPGRSCWSWVLQLQPVVALL